MDSVSLICNHIKGKRRECLLKNVRKLTAFLLVTVMLGTGCTKSDQKDENHSPISVRPNGTASPRPQAAPAPQAETSAQAAPVPQAEQSAQAAPTPKAEPPTQAAPVPKAGPPAQAAPVPKSKPPGQPVATLTVKVEEVFKGNCMVCHGDQLQGKIGPNLQKVGSLLTKEQVLKQIRGGGSDMPPFESSLSKEEIDALAEWLAGKK